MVNKPVIHVEVVFAADARNVLRVALELAAGSTVAQAVDRSNFLSGMHPDVVRGLEVGVWKRKVATGHVLREHDRVELYRPLKVDPKVARRERFTQQGAKGAGLFAKRRAGAKSGY